MEALSWGPDIMKALYYAYEPITDFAGFRIGNALELDWREFLTSYLLISKSLELSRGQLEKIKGGFWDRRTLKNPNQIFVFCVILIKEMNEHELFGRRSVPRSGISRRNRRKDPTDYI